MGGRNSIDALRRAYRNKGARRRGAAFRVSPSRFAPISSHLTRRVFRNLAELDAAKTGTCAFRHIISIGLTLLCSTL